MKKKCIIRANSSSHTHCSVSFWSFLLPFNWWVMFNVL